MATYNANRFSPRGGTGAQAKTQAELLAEELAKRQQTAPPAGSQQAPAITGRQQAPAITGRQQAPAQPAVPPPAPPAVGRQETSAATSNKDLLELAQQTAQQEVASGRLEPPAAQQQYDKKDLPEWAEQAVASQQSIGAIPPGFGLGLQPQPGFGLGQPAPSPGGPMEPPVIPAQSPPIPVTPQNPSFPGGPMEPPPLNLQTGISAAESDLQDLTEQAIRDLLSGQGLDTEAEKEARRQQASVDEAKKIQALRARTGLGGMGLTGAAGALESQVRAEGTRARAITEAELDRAARDEALRRLQTGIGAGQAERGMGIKEKVFGIEMDMYEKEMDQDLNGDGLIGRTPVGGDVGDGDPKNNPDYLEAEEEAKQEALPEVREGRENQMSQQQAQEKFREQYGATLGDVSWGTGLDRVSFNNTAVLTYDDPEWGIVTVYQRPDGRFFKLLIKDLR